MRYAICNETFQGWDWERTCGFVGECGYDAIEIAPFTLATDVRTIASPERDWIRRIAERQGLAIVGLHWLLVSPEGLSVTSADADVRKTTSDYLTALADLCADLGGTVMVFGSPAQRRIPDGMARATASEHYVRTLMPALDRAAASGIVVCVEPLPAPEANFILTLDEASAMVEMLDHPAARTIFDVKSASSEGQPLPELIRTHASVIAHVHANDANRRGPGFGDTDFVPILATLDEIGYSGSVSVEVFDYSPNPETIAVESLKHLRACERR